MNGTTKVQGHGCQMRIGVYLRGWYDLQCQTQRLGRGIQVHWTCPVNWVKNIVEGKNQGSFCGIVFAICRLKRVEIGYEIVRSRIRACIVFHGAILSAILDFVIGFVSIFYNWCALPLRTIQWKKRSLCINKWLTCRQLLWFIAAILFVILGFVIRFVSNFKNWYTPSLRAIQ